MHPFACSKRRSLKYVKQEFAVLALRRAAEEQVGRHACDLQRRRAGAGERYLSTVMMAATRDECERMGVNQRVLLSDQAGRQFYVPPLG